MNLMEDAKIIDLFWARNEDAIAETDAAYGRKLRFLANKILNNLADTEESVSDTYMKTWEVIPPQRPVCFYAFIASICRHLSFHKADWNRAAKRTPRSRTPAGTESWRQRSWDGC